MRGVVGDLWGIVSIAHSVKSDDVEDVGGMGMYVERGEGMSVGEVGEGVSRRVALQRRAKICRCCSLSPTNRLEKICRRPMVGRGSMSQNGRLNKIT